MSQMRKQTIKRLKSLIRFHVQMMLNRFDDYCVMINEWIHLSEPYLTTFITQRRNYVQKMEDHHPKKESEGQRNETHHAICGHADNTFVSKRDWNSGIVAKKKSAQQEIEDNMVNHLINGLSVD